MQRRLQRRGALELGLRDTIATHRTTGAAHFRSYMLSAFITRHERSGRLASAARIELLTTSIGLDCRNPRHAALVSARRARSVSRPVRRADHVTALKQKAYAVTAPNPAPACAIAR